MMGNLNSASLHSIVVDEEEIFVLSDDESIAILEGAGIDGESLSEIGIPQFWWKVISGSDRLALALHRGPQTFGQWWFLVLCLIGDEYRRVELLQGECESCDWKGWVATPLSNDIYTGSPDRIAAFNRAKALPVVGCPKCGGRLNKHAVWAAHG